MTLLDQPCILEILPTIHPFRRGKFRLMKPLMFEGYTVPIGFITDGLTSLLFSWLFPAIHSYTPAAIIHDYLLDEYVAKGKMKRKTADQIFFRALHQLGIPNWVAHVMYPPVRAYSIIIVPLRKLLKGLV